MGKIREGMIVVGALVSCEMRDELDQIAEKEGKNRSDVVRDALQGIIKKKRGDKIEWYTFQEKFPLKYL